MGVWVGVGVWNTPCKDTCACMHVCTCMLNMINMDVSMEAAICNYYTCNKT